MLRDECWARAYLRKKKQNIKSKNPENLPGRKQMRDTLCVFLLCIIFSLVYFYSFAVVPMFRTMPTITIG